MNAIPGWPADVPLPSDPLWKRDYAASVRRLVREDIDVPLANLFVSAARPISGVPRVSIALAVLRFSPRISRKTWISCSDAILRAVARRKPDAVQVP
jgi:hypothetical protein